MPKLINWYDLAGGFCESVVSGPPEYAGSISSFAMIIAGLFGLFLSRNHNILIRVTSASLAVTGVGSTFYHWTLYIGWGLIDSIPMLIASWLGGYLGMDAIIYKLIALDRGQRRNYERVSSLLALIYVGSMVLSIVFSHVEGLSSFFPIMFLVAELSIALAVILMRFVANKDLKNNAGLRQAFKVMYIGFGSSVLAAIVWFTIEKLCPKPPFHWMRYTYAHALWHTTISIGMYYIMQFFIYIHSFYTGKNPRFVRTKNRWNWVFILIPVVDNGDGEPLLVGS